MVFSSDPADLAEMRQGRLSAALLERYEADVRRSRWTAWILPFAIVSFVAFPAVWPNVPHAQAAIALAITEAIALVGCIALVRWIGRRAIARVRKERVECSVGPIRNLRRSAYGPKYYLMVGGQTLAARRDVIDRMRTELEAKSHRVYHLARLGDVVGIEPA